MTTGNWPGPSPPPRPVSPTSTTEWEPRFPWISMVVWPRRRLFYGRRRASTRAPWGDVPLPLPRPLPAVAGVAERPRARCGPAHASGPVRHRGPRPAAPLGRRPRSPAGRLHQPARERPSIGTWPSSPPCSTGCGTRTWTWSSPSGRTATPPCWGPQPENVRVERYLAQSLLFPLCDLVVTHGGGGTTLAALNGGIPLLIVPQGGDQFLTAERACAAGVARSVTELTSTPRASAGRSASSSLTAPIETGRGTSSRD
jgi:hypothetical protein